MVHPESDQVVRDAARLVGKSAGRIVLTVVIDADSAEQDLEHQCQQARTLLHDRVGWLPRQAAPTIRPAPVGG